MLTSSEFIDRFIDEFHPQVKLNDPAHLFKHFHNVYLCGKKINQDLDLCYTDLEIAMVAYLHDLFAWSRVNHHELSGLYVKTTDHPLIIEGLESIADFYYTDVESVRDQLSKACAEHRASFKGEFSNGFSELMNAADYELPEGLGPMLLRAYQYGKANGLGTTHEEWVSRAKEHMVEKYGRHGYAKYPDLYREVFWRELGDIYREIDDLTCGIADEFISSLI